MIEPPCHSYRLACLELSRLTEELGILSTSVIGICAAAETQPVAIRARIAAAFFACLKSSVSAPFRIVLVDPLWATSSERRLERERRSKSKQASGKQPKRRKEHPSTFSVVPLPVRVRNQVCGHLGGKEIGDRRVSKTQGIKVIDLVVKPISGLPELTRGQSGAMAIIAGGECNFLHESIDAGCDATRLKKLPTKGKRSGTKIMPTALTRDLTICTQDKALAKKLFKLLTPSGKESSLERVKAAIRELQSSRASIATMADDSNGKFGQLLKNVRHRELTGAPDAAAILAMSPKHAGVDAFIGVTRRTTTVMIAIAAKALDGGMVALPLVSNAVDRDSSDVGEQLTESSCFQYVIGDTPPILPDMWVRSPNVFLIATGITSHPLLEGVQFEEAPAHSGFPDSSIATDHSVSPDAAKATVRVQTHSIILNGASQTIRFIRHTRDLQKDHLHSVEKKSRLQNALEVYINFENSVRQALAEAQDKAETLQKKRGVPPLMESNLI